MAKTAARSAFELYLEGQKLFSVIERKHLEAAADKFRQAVKLAPDFARGWGHLAYALAQIVVGGHAKSPDEAAALLSTAERHARKAVKLDGQDYANRWDLAFVWLNQGRMDEALAEYERALRLFDNRTDMLDRRMDLLVEMAEAYVYAGNTERAFALLDRAFRIPDWYRWIRAWACYNARDYKGVAQQIGAMRKKYGDAGYVPDIQLLLAAAQAQGGAVPRAQKSMRRVEDGRPGWSIERELARNPFRNAKDRQHWAEGMKKAGFR
jgi:tetratricopeptide (TPR) repeat protein